MYKQNKCPACGGGCDMTHPLMLSLFSQYAFAWFPGMGSMSIILLLIHVGALSIKEREWRIYRMVSISTCFQSMPIYIFAPSMQIKRNSEGKKTKISKDNPIAYTKSGLLSPGQKGQHNDWQKVKTMCAKNPFWCSMATSLQGNCWIFYAEREKWPFKYCWSLSWLSFCK